MGQPRPRPPPSRPLLRRHRLLPACTTPVPKTRRSPPTSRHPRAPRGYLPRRPPAASRPRRLAASAGHPERPPPPHQRPHTRPAGQPQDSAQSAQFVNRDTLITVVANLLECRRPLAAKVLADDTLPGEALGERLRFRLGRSA